MTLTDIIKLRCQGESLETIPENEDAEKKTVMDMIIAELKESLKGVLSRRPLLRNTFQDPNRDCNNFDPGM